MSVHNLFYLDNFIEEKIEKIDRNKILKRRTLFSNTKDKQIKFNNICKNVSEYFISEWETDQGKSVEASDELLNLQRRAIIGYEQEVNFFSSKIKDYLKKNNLLHEWYPSWYPDLPTAIFHENWGLAGIYPWKNMLNSTSAKIIGTRIYFLVNGKQQLQEHRISPERFYQLRRALLLRNPEKRLDEHHAEVYMLDGTRITIFEPPLVKEPAVIFRKYIVDSLTFEEQAKRGTIPFDMIPMLKAKVKIGYNVCFIGPVRSAKTTFLSTWQSYEDTSLEGIQVETDPEIPQHTISPLAPIIQFVADEDKLKKIVKLLVRGDADYMIMAEARDGIALKIATMVTAKGTRRVKSTFHSSDPADFPLDAANEIISEYPGTDLFTTIAKVAKGYNYLYELCQLKDKSQKRLKGIYELRYNPTTFEITVHQICKYDFMTDSWTFKYDIGEDKEEIAYEENIEAFNIFKNELKKLSEKYPMQGDHITKPYYNNFIKA